MALARDTLNTAPGHHPNTNPAPRRYLTVPPLIQHPHDVLTACRHGPTGRRVRVLHLAYRF